MRTDPPAGSEVPVVDEAMQRRAQALQAITIPAPPEAPAPRGKNKSQLRRERKAAEQLATRRALEEQFGITIKPSKPVVGGRYAGVKQPSPLRYGGRLAKGARRG